jgi:hypothetical protein
MSDINGQLTTGSLLSNPYVIDIIQSSNSIQNVSGTSGADVTATLTALQDQITALQGQVVALESRVAALEGA